mgnify:CR=1 FL=1
MVYEAKPGATDARAFAAAHRKQLMADVTERGGILLRGFGVASAVEFEEVLKECGIDLVAD